VSENPGPVSGGEPQTSGQSSGMPAEPAIASSPPRVIPAITTPNAPGSPVSPPAPAPPVAPTGARSPARGEVAAEAKRTRDESEPGPRRALGRWTTELFAAYLAIVVSLLIALRATVDSLDFVGVGWIILLTVLPLVPWLLPRLGPFLKSLSPYLQSFSLGGVQLELRAVEDAAIVVPTSGNLAPIANDQSGFSSSTAIVDLVSQLRNLRRDGAPPVGVIDLQDGQKWLLPNLYFLCFMLEADPILTELVFTEKRAEVDGYFVLACGPSDFRRRVDVAVTEYSAVATTLALTPGRLIDASYANDLTGKFQAFLSALNATVPAGAPRDHVFGYLNAARVTELVGAARAPFVDDPGTTLSDSTLVTVLNASQRYLPWTSAALLVGIIDRDQVALAVARVALARS
jgi:hypothetical protein